MIECPLCDGEGVYGDSLWGLITCPECNGEGELTPEQDERRWLRLAAHMAAVVTAANATEV